MSKSQKQKAIETGRKYTKQIIQRADIPHIYTSPQIERQRTKYYRLM